MLYRTSVLLVFLIKLWAFENRQFVYRLYSSTGPVCMVGSHTNNLPTPTDLTEDVYGKDKIPFLKQQIKNRPRWL